MVLERYHFCQVWIWKKLWGEDSTCLNPFDGDENGSLVAADVVHLRFPHLAKVALPQHLQALGFDIELGGQEKQIERKSDEKEIENDGKCRRRRMHR